MKKKNLRSANSAPTTRQTRKRTHSETEYEVEHEETLQDGEHEKSGDLMDQNMEIDGESLKSMSTESSFKTTECVSWKSSNTANQTCQSVSQISNKANQIRDSNKAFNLLETVSESPKTNNVVSMPCDGDFTIPHQHDVNNNAQFDESREDQSEREKCKVKAIDENSRHGFGNELRDQKAFTDATRDRHDGDGESSLDNEDSMCSANTGDTVVRIHLHGTDIEPSYQEEVAVGQECEAESGPQEQLPTYDQTDALPIQTRQRILEAPSKSNSPCAEQALMHHYHEQHIRVAQPPRSHEEKSMSVSNQSSSDNCVYKEGEMRTNFAGILTLPSTRTSQNVVGESILIRQQGQTQYSGQSYGHLVLQEQNDQRGQQVFLPSSSFAPGDPNHSHADGDINSCPIAAEQLASELVKTYSGSNSHMISEILTQEGARQLVCEEHQQHQPNPQQFVTVSQNDQQDDQPRQFPCSSPDQPEEAQQFVSPLEDQQNQPQQLASVDNHHHHQQQQQQHQFVCEGNQQVESQQFVHEGNQNQPGPQQQFVVERNHPVESHQFVCEGFEQQSQESGLSEYAGTSQPELHDNVDLLNTPQQLPVEDVLYPHQAARDNRQTSHHGNKSSGSFGSPQACSTPDSFRNNLRFDQRTENPCPEPGGFHTRQPQMYQGYPGPLSPDIMSLGPNIRNSKQSHSLPYEFNQLHDDHRASQYRKEFSPQLEGVPFYNEQAGSGMLSAIRSPTALEQGIGEFPRLAGGETKMTFTPRVMMTSRLSHSYQSQKQHASATQQSMTDMDYSSIYPRKDFIEKAAGMKLPCQLPGNAGQKAGSYDQNPPPKKRHRMSRHSSPRNPHPQHQPPQPPSMPLIDDMIARYPPNFSRDSDQSNHKYFVVNPSDATSMTSKNLLCKYIDFLILENEQITEISKSISPPVDIYVTEDMYFMDSLRYRVPFPSKKFTEWVGSFYPRLKFWEMEFKGVRPQPATEAMLKMVDSRPIQQMLEDTFYFFQREVMNVVSLVEGSA